MTAPVAPDQAVRDRLGTDLGETFFVEAAAGTGKTSTLVARVVSLVTSGRAEVRAIASITFTEKAAAELRDRIRGALEDAARAPDRSDDERQRAQAALAAVDDAAISTLHGFTHRILAGHPLEAGLPPGFEVLDEVDAAATFERHWERFVGDLLADPEAREPLLRAFTLGLRIRHLRDLALAFHGHWERLEQPLARADEPPAIDPSPVAGPLAEALAMRDACTDPRDAMAAQLAEVAGVIERLDTAPDGLSALAALVDLPRLSTAIGRKANWGDGPVLESVRERLGAASEARAALLSALGRSIGLRLGERVRRFVLDAAERRRRDGRLEFHDLLVRARDLLRDHGGVRRTERAHYRWILVDELQDTDPLQMELAVLLASDGNGPEHTVEPGRLFLVGDPKQSIYRFRRADITLYHEAERRFGSSDARLVANFRSAPPIVDWVNGVFEALFAGGRPGVQAAHVPLRPTRRTVGASVRVVGGACAEPAAAARHRQARDVARAVAAVRREAWPVEDGTGRTRPARYGDVAILMPTRRLLPDLEHVLAEAEIPYRIESRSLLFATQEVRDLLSILRAIDDPTDEVAVVAALRSPGFGCRDDELLDFRRRGGRWSYLEPRPGDVDPGHPVWLALGALATLHARRRWEPLHALVERVVRECRLLELATAHARPRDLWRRLRFVVDQARAFGEAGGTSLREFVDWADGQADEQARVNEAIVPEPDDDAVRVMTVHAAKGLEFPVVVIAGLDAGRPSARPPALFGPDGAVELEIGPQHLMLATPGYKERLAHEREAQEAEARRVLYVAATRARDHLVVCLHHKEGLSCAAATLVEAGADRPELRWQPDHATPDPERAEAGDVRFDDDAGRRRAWIDRRDALLSAHGRAPAVAATRLAAGPEPADDHERPPWRRGRAGSSLGRAVHATLQSVDLRTGQGLEAVVRAQAAAEGIPGREGEVARLARAAIGAPSVRAAVESGRYWREVYVGAPIEGVVLEGYVDLLYESDDGLVVVDYKTDRLGPGADLTRYRLQAAAYAVALEAALGRPVARCVLVFVGDGRAREVEVADLAGAVGSGSWPL